MNLKNINVSLDKLMLDPNNYRLDYDKDLRKYSDDEVVDAQAKTMDNLEKEKLRELRNSIVINGFLEMDRVVVRPLEGNCLNGLYLIVEGNRRIAALKGLIEDYSEGEIELPDKILRKIKSVSVICVEGTSEEIKEFSAGLMGVRHVSGPKKWTGYQSARLIDDRHVAGDSFDKIGALLGISDLEAERRFKNYRAFQQMKENDKYGDSILQKHYTLLAEFRSNSKDWLGWSEDEAKDVYEFTNIHNTERVYSAITKGLESKAEVNNVNQARDFISRLSSDEQKKMIEEGAVRFEDFPPLIGDEAGRLRQLKNFKHLLDSMANSEVTNNELKLLQGIYGAVDSIVGEHHR